MARNDNSDNDNLHAFPVSNPSSNPSDDPQGGCATPAFDGLEVTIRVPDWVKSGDIPEAELARILRQIARVANYLSSSVTRVAALDDSGKQVGAAAQVAQSIFNVAAQSESSALQIERAANRIVPPTTPGPTIMGRA